MSAWSGPFAWLVLAEPVPAGRLGELTEEVSQAQLGAQRFDSPSAQLAVQRLSARHAELRQAAATGLWQVRLLAGGPAPHAAAQVAGLLCASADLERPALRPGPGGRGRRAGRDPGPRPGRGPCAARRRGIPGGRRARPSRGPGVIRISRLRPGRFTPRPGWSPRWPGRPARELPGLRFVLRPDFDVTPETTNGWAEGEAPVTVGTVLDWNRMPARRAGRCRVRR